MRFTVSTQPLNALSARFYAKDELAQRQVRTTVRRWGRRIYLTTFNLTPVWRGNMKKLLKWELTNKGLSFQVGWEEADFTRRRLKFYVIPVLFGTSLMAGRDVLFAANRSNYEAFRSDLNIDLRRALRRRG